MFGKFLNIRLTRFNTYIFTETNISYKSKYKRNFNDFKSYATKLDNSISRARTNIYNLVMFNEFEYCFTQTISSKYDRTQLNTLINKFRSTLKYMRKLSGLEFKYIIVPEYHLDEKCFHVHGFLNSAFKDFIYLNDNGYYSVKYLDHIGFNSISKIRSHEAFTKYFTKYITKELCLTRNKGERIYYCSKGLKRDNSILKIESVEIAPIHYDFKNPFVFKTTVNEKKYYNFVTSIENNNSYHYNIIN